MQIRNTTITCFAALATTAVVAIEHGELGEFHGVKYRWHQLAQGHYTGVVPEDWDEKVHKPSDEEWDYSHLLKRQPEMTNTSSELERRDIADTCKIVVGCVKEYGPYTIASISTLWQTSVYYAAEKVGKPIFEFLIQPYIVTLGTDVGTNFVGGTMAGMAYTAINNKLWPPEQCSTESSQADIIAAMMAAALKANPNANSVSVTMTKGQDGKDEAITYSVSINQGSAIDSANCQPSGLPVAQRRLYIDF